MLRNMHDSTTYLIFVHHEGEPIQVFYSTKKMQLSRFITDIYILTALSTYSNIVGHVHGPTLKRLPYCVHKYFMPQHVLSRISCLKPVTDKQVFYDKFLYGEFYLPSGRVYVRQILYDKFLVF